jgi:DNA-binding LacI/PurR family transcriptional regulator
MGLGVIRAAQRRGLRIPADLSVAAMDDIPMTLLSDPPLTTVRVDRYGLGQRATEMLIGLVQKAYTGPVKVILKPELVERASCRSVIPNAIP